MSDCPRCGRPLDPDAARCFACATGEPRLVGTVARPNAAFRRNPAALWFLAGGAVGALVGFVVGLVGAIANLLSGGQPSGFALGATVTGGVLGALGTLAWKSLLRPVFLALFASQKFEREYGTPEEQGIIRRAGPPVKGGHEG